MIVKMIKKIPRLVCLQEMCEIDYDTFKAVQSWEETEVTGEVGAVLIAGGWCEVVVKPIIKPEVIEDGD